MIPTKEEMRQALEKRQGKELQQRFFAATVAICGLGGLGSNIAISLARAGVGKLILIDFDKVDVTNLHRQQYKASQIGRYKTEALSENLKEIAPYVELETHTTRMTEQNVVELLKEADVICEAFDDAQAKAMLTNSVLENFPQKYFVAASGMAGIGSANSIRTRQITKRFYLCGDGVSDVGDDIGLVSSRVMLCAAHKERGTNMDNDKLVIGGHEFRSRFILGSGKYSLNLIEAAIKDAGAEIITLAVRRANTKEQENILDFIPKGVTLLPNTSGARDAKEAVRIARLARELGCGDFVKVEIMRDSKYLLPDNQETIRATEILAKEGFVVMPYMYPDLNAARDLVNAGAAAVMPLASPIGSNKGLATKEFIQILIDEIELPIIVDAGIGKPSQACEAMEMGAAAIMANTALATAGNLPMMASAFKDAIEAGRKAYLAGLGRVLTRGAAASDPLTGFLRD